MSVTMKPSEFLRDVGRPIAYYPRMRRLTGSTTATIFLCQFIYWTGKEAAGDGWIYKTSKEIDEETGLSYDEQKTAREKLKAAGLIEEKYARLDHLMYFRVCFETLDEKWRNGLPAIPETDNTALGNAASACSLISNTETTAENTSAKPRQKMTAADLHGIESAIATNRPVTQADLPDPRIGEVALQIERGLGVRPDFGNPKWETVIKTIIKREAEGQLLQTYIDWCREHKFDAPKVAQIATKPTIINDTWPAAFGADEPLPKYYRPLP